MASGCSHAKHIPLESAGICNPLDINPHELIQA